MCQLCERKYDESAVVSSHKENRELLAGDPWTTLECGVDNEDRLFLIACGEDETEHYYPKFCPECGRQFQR